MKTPTLLLNIVTASFTLVAAGQAVAQWTPIELKVEDEDVGTIEVEGPHRGVYREVKTKTVEYSVSARGDSLAGDSTSTYQITVIGSASAPQNPVYKGKLYEEWKKVKISFPYFDLKTLSYSYLAPVRRCNDLLKEASGAAREDFLFRGGAISIGSAYPVRGTIVDPPGASKVLQLPVNIRCLPLDQNPLRTTLRVEPAKVTQVGKFLCPMELTLHGTAESREKFYGKSIFVGPHYLSALTVLNYTGPGTRNVTATYKVNWQQMGGFTTAPNQEPKKQDLTFQFNIADQDGKLQKSVKKHVVVSCRKVQVNAPTASDDMVINQADD